MDTNPLLDDPLHDSDTANSTHFTKHAVPLQPVSSEEEIRTSAEFVVQSVPLPEIDTPSPATASSPTYGTAAAPQNINELSAEDIREDY
ncbi:hypothetical protein I8H83_04665 [Candidatus Saccharibacteria bacterium]|nr:hypothetical protein [Candidatus Saccharibacteria bacterium]MBH2007873.1 hypothetical protein [Candidatus Saccharibacteria bacterium]